MFKRLSLAATLTLIVSVGLIACGAPQSSGGGGGGDGGQEEDFKTDLQLGTGSVGGVYFPLGQELANIFTDNIKVDGFNVSSVESGASVDNLAQIARGDLQLGIAQNNTAQQAVAGKGEVKGKAVKNAGFMGQLYPEAISIITLESAGIDKVEDLKGKRVAIGPPGGATRGAADLVLDAYGIKHGDYKALEEDSRTAQTKLQAGNLDASIEVVGVPSASISELQATTGKVKLLSLSSEAQKKIVDASGYRPYEIPADSYDFLKDPLVSVSAFATMFGSTNQIDEDLGYKITKTIYEKSDSLTLAQKQFIKPESALEGRGDLPLHPGAKKYFEEEGLLEGE